MDDSLVEEIVQKVIERMLKILPEVVGNLMSSHALNFKLSEDFYKTNPDFKNHRDLVRESIAKIDLENPTLGYEEILKKAIPVINAGIKDKMSVTMERPSERPPLDLNGNI